MKKRILYILPSLNTGGAEIQTINQINYLLQSNEEIFLAILTTQVDLIDNLKLDRKRIWIYDNKGRSFNFLGTELILFCGKIAWTLNSFLKINSINSVIAVMDPSCIVARVNKLLRFLSFQSNYDLIAYYRDVNYDTSPLNTLGKKIFNKINSFLAFFFDNKTIFISQAVKENIMKNFFTRNENVIYNSLPFREVDDDVGKDYLSKIGLSLKTYNLLIPGRLDPKKGHIFFIDAWLEFIEEEKLSKDQFLIIFNGGGRFFNDIQNYITSKSLDKTFHITGTVANDLVLSFMKVMDITVIPSIHEGFGNVAIEALMQGSIILASDSGGLKEIVIDGRNGFLFKSNNSLDLKSKLKKVLAKDFKIDRQTLREDFLKRFTLEAQVLRIKEVIEG